MITVLTEEYKLVVEYATYFVNYTIHPYFTTDFIWYRRMDPYYPGNGTTDHLGNPIDNVKMTISKWGRNGNIVWFLESCPEFSLNQSFNFFRDYFELNVTYIPGTKKVVTTYFIGLFSASRTLYSLVSDSTGRYNRYVPGAPENTPSSNVIGGWYPRNGMFAPACDMRAYGSSLGVEWGYNETVAYIASPQWMQPKNPTNGGPSVFGLKFSSINSVVPNPALGTSKTFQMFVRPYQYTDGKPRGYDVGYAQWIGAKIANAWGNHDTPIFPLTIMDLGSWTSTFRNWVENSQVKVATYSNNPAQINWNYKSASRANYKPDDPTHVPTAWQIYKSPGTPYTDSSGSVICSPVSGPYNQQGTFRWHLIMNDSSPSWWWGSKGVFWDMMDSTDSLNQPRNDYQQRPEFVFLGYLHLVKESYASGYWDYVITNSYMPVIHLAIASDLTVMEGYEPSSAFGVSMKAQTISTMNFVKNIPKEYRPNILVYQYYDATDNPSDQVDVYSALFGAARYGFYITLYSYSSYDSQMHNLVMAEEMFKAMGTGRDDDERIEVATLDLGSEGSSITTNASMVVTLGSGSPTVTFLSSFDKYTITNLHSGSNQFTFVLPTTKLYEKGNDIESDGRMTFFPDGKAVFRGTISPEKTGHILGRNDVFVYHQVSGNVTVNLVQKNNSYAKLNVSATGGTTMIKLAGFTPGQTYDIVINGQVLYKVSADNQGIVQFTHAYGIENQVIVQKGSATDTTAPTVVSTTPADGERDVEVTEKITVFFSEAMNTTATEMAFSLMRKGSTVSGSVQWNSQKTTMTFTPSTLLEYSTTYFINISTGAKDVAGNRLISSISYSFTTKGTDETTPPRITDVYPKKGSTDVTLGTMIVLTFSEPMNTTITSRSFHLTSQQGETSGKFEWLDNNTTLIFTPAGGLLPSTTYMLLVESRASDIFGNNLTEPFTSTFRTVEDKTDDIPPSIQSTIPVAGAEGVDVTQDIIIVFSERMNKTSVENAFSLESSSQQVHGIFLWDSNAQVLVFTPHSQLEYNTTYNLTVQSSARDIAGNALASKFESAFTTENGQTTNAPTVIDIYPFDGCTDVQLSSNIIVTFDKIMDVAKTNEAIHVIRSGVELTGEKYWMAKNTTLVFVPATMLTPASEYTVTVSASATDIFGNPLGRDFSSRFTTTSSQQDTVPPIILHQPTSNAEVGRVYELRANVTDVNKLSFVKLSYIDVDGIYHEVAMGLGQYCFDATIQAQTKEGTIRYRILAADEYGNLATTQEYSILVRDTTSPEIQIVSPLPGSKIIEITNIETIARDNYGIRSVEFYVDDALVANDGQEPYVAPFNPRDFKEGAHRLLVKAIDLVGLGAESSLDIIVEHVDTEAPSIVNVFPPNGMTDVPVNTSITITFSEAMDHQSTEAAIEIEGGDQFIEFYVDWQSDSYLIITPVNPLNFSTLYYINISATAMDLFGNRLISAWQTVFKTLEIPDTNPPYVVSHSPNNGQTMINLDEKVVVVFSESMNATSVERAFLMRSGSEKIAGQFIWSESNIVMTFVPDNFLNISTTYQITISKNAKDLAGNGLLVDLSFSFTTYSSMENGSISGIVVFDSKPVEGVIVTDGSRYVATGPDGRFLILDVPPGKYTITVAKFGYACNKLVSVTVERGVSISGIIFDIEESPGNSTITGIVVSKNGYPIPSATITLKGFTEKTFTDENGRFIITGVPPGNYWIKASKLFHKSTTISDINIKAGEDLEIVLISLTSNFESTTPQSYGENTNPADGGVILSIAMGAGALALAGAMIMKKPWRSEKTRTNARYEFERDASDESSKEIRIAQIRRIDQQFENNTFLQDQKKENLERDDGQKTTDFVRIKSNIDPKGEEDFERGLKELERLV
ncbi:MAG: Ig-like domain-containing protein [Methanomassiliicoccales archaeon]|nr:Ig-like domain-containing protein [Methanomassiliicoccales archaeon]